MGNENRIKGSLNRVLRSMFQQRKEEKFPKQDNPEVIQTTATTRAGISQRRGWRHERWPRG